MIWYNSKLQFVLLISVFLLGCASKQKENWVPDPQKYLKNTNHLCNALKSSVINKFCDLDNMSTKHMDDYKPFMQHTLGKIIRNYKAPKKDGTEYYGQITYCLEVDGTINQIELLQPSGHSGLDNAFLNAIRKLDIQPIPEDPCLLNYVHYKKNTVYYDHNDMAD